jgi:aarF domain-containing kinase
MDLASGQPVPQSEGFDDVLPANVAAVSLLPPVSGIALTSRLLQVVAAGMHFLVVLTCNRGTPEGERRAADALQASLTRLGPTFVKLAQTLSMRPDLIGEVYTASLGKLQDNVPPFPTHEAYGILEEELQRPLSKVFTYLSPEPIAAASLGQVYRGVLQPELGGIEVAVKIQRPGAENSIALDVQLLRQVIGIAQQIAGIQRDLRVLADEVGVALRGECDFRNEVSNAQIFTKSHAALPFVTSPRAVTELCSRRVLVSEWIDGRSPSQLVPLSESTEDKSARRDILNLVRMGIQCSLAQLLVTGCMHGDPHSGNLLLTKDGRLCYLDFGLIVRVSPRHRQAMMAALIHLGLGEWGRLADDLDQLDLLKPDTDKNQLALELEKEFQAVLGLAGNEYAIQGIGTIQSQLPLLSLQTSSLSFSTLAGVLFRVAFKFRFTLPTYFPLVVRSISSLEGVALLVDPGFKLIAAGMPVVLNQLLSDRRPAAQELLKELLLAPSGALRTDETTRQILQVWLSAAQQAARAEVLASKPSAGVDADSPSASVSVAAVDMASLLLDRRNVPLRRTLMLSNPAATLAGMPVDMRKQLLDVLTQALSTNDLSAAAAGLLEGSGHARAQRKRLWMLFIASVPRVLRSPPSSVFKLVMFTGAVIMALFRAVLQKLWKRLMGWFDPGTRRSGPGSASAAV